jgi:hypothetical protein
METLMITAREWRLDGSRSFRSGSEHLKAREMRTTV